MTNVRFQERQNNQESLQVCVVEPSGRVSSNRRVGNSVDEVIGVVGKNRRRVRVTAEACNGSAAFLDALREKTSWETRLCHPGYAQRMRMNPDKTDKSDSELIADLTRVGYLPEVYLASPEIRDLRSLVRYRGQQMAEARSTKVRIRALLRNNRIAYPKGSKLWSKVGLQWLSKGTGLTGHSAWILSRYLRQLHQQLEEVREATLRMSEFVTGDIVCQELLKQRGIGVVTAAIFRAEIGTFRRFRTGKQLARFCGLSPCNRSSGTTSADSGVIRAGNPLLKAAITQGVWTLIRFDETWKPFAERLLEAGKPKGVVAAAVANRWIRKLFHEVKEL